MLVGGGKGWGVLWRFLALGLLHPIRLCWTPVGTAGYGQSKTTGARRGPVGVYYVAVDRLCLRCLLYLDPVKHVLP